MEEVVVTYNVSQNGSFGFLIVLFIALTGLNAGSYLASFLFISLGRREYLPLAKLSGLAVVTLWGLAPVLLLLDIGQPLRFWHLFAYFSPSSPMAWGTVILTVYPFLAAIYLYFLFQEKQEKAKLWGAIGLPVALGSHAFVGFVLSFTKARVLWATSLTPIFFLVTAALAGLSLVIILDTFRYYFFLNHSPEDQAGERLIFHHLGKALYMLILADMGLILFYLLILGISPPLFHQALNLLTPGSTYTSSLYQSVFIGLVAPLILLIVPQTSRSPFGQLIASSMVIFGIFSMGNLVMAAAQSLPLI